MSLRDIPAALWLALLLVWAPIQTVRVGLRLRGAARAGESATLQRMRDRTRPQLYRDTIFGLAQIFVITLLLDWIDGWRALRQALAFPPAGWAWAIGCLAGSQAIAVTTMVVRRLRGIPLDPQIARLLPRTGSERAAFLGVALAAGIAEEFFYRGFAPDHLARWGIPMWMAMGVAIISFALMHGYKSAAGMLRSGLAGAVVAIPVLVTGTLLPSIVAHTLQDVVAGNVTLPLARGLGVAMAPESSRGASTAAEPEIPAAPVA
jgi:membrane protease YdiL (CAAX protease family)